MTLQVKLVREQRNTIINTMIREISLLMTMVVPYNMKLKNLTKSNQKIYGVLSPSKDGHFEILGKISNVSKNAKVYYGNNYKSIEIKTTKYDSHSKTMTFDLYANINDIVDGLAFAGDMRFFVKDDDQIKAETKD